MDKIKILLVDDEKDLIDLMSIKLEYDGFEVHKAFNGNEAIEKIYESTPDIVLLDCMMPEMNGYQVCKKLRAEEKYKDLPVIMLTARAQAEDKMWGEEVGVSHYLTKPYEYSELMKTIKKVLRQ